MSECTREGNARLSRVNTLHNPIVKIERDNVLKPDDVAAMFSVSYDYIRTEDELKAITNKIVERFTGGVT